MSESESSESESSSSEEEEKQKLIQELERLRNLDPNIDTEPEIGFDNYEEPRVGLAAENGGRLVHEIWYL